MSLAKDLLIAAAVLVAAGCKDQSTTPSGTINLSVPALATAVAIPPQFTCDGRDRSPELTWSGAPAGTRSYAVILDDPDAPGGTFDHWAVFDIDAKVDGLAEGAGNGAIPAARQARNDFGGEGYRGPCPPPGHGTHNYRFRLFALDLAKLDVGASPGIDEVEQALGGHVLGTAAVTATYRRD